jgi:histidinol dehydrogenase
VHRCCFIHAIPTVEGPELPALLAGLARNEAQEVATRDAVEALLRDVRSRGVDACLDASERLDGVRPTELRVPKIVFQEALSKLQAEQPALISALESLMGGVRRFAQAQRASLKDLQLDLAGGGTVGERWVPLQAAGVYVPGGRAFYPSTFAMTVIPAQEAGVKRIVAVTPPKPEGVDPLILATAALLGVDELVTLGGAQAIAWLAYEAKVDLIAGPGNRFVAEAKRQLVGTVGIDSVAGPTEVLILADASADPAWLAEDMLAQAEHDPDAASVLVSEDPGLLKAVAQELEARITTSPRQEILRQSIPTHGRLVLAPQSVAIAFAQAWAPEHLELVVRDPEAWTPFLTTAGALFVGAASAEAFGDYGIGPNHVLPTGRTARFASPLGVATYLKRQSVLTLSAQDAATAAPWVETLAQAEGLPHHGRSASSRLHHPKPTGD